ncbi:MAG: lipid-A-disaccharide synthase, partial [Campylobacterota bacterium]
MKILVSALEHSANTHLQKIIQKRHDLELVGIFDKRLGDPLYDNSDTAIMGIVDALKKLRFFLKLRDEMVEAAKDVEKVLLIDGSGFNLPLAKKLKQTYPSLEITYYILPQAWAWRKYRIKKIQKYCDRLFSILPFECGYYTQKCRYVGHPVLDSMDEFKTDYKSKTIVFMPGSRKKEIERLMPVFRELREKFSDCKTLLVVPKFLKDSPYYGDTSGFILTHDTKAALLEAKHAFICSGTATFEACVIGTPLTLCYIANTIDYAIVKAVTDLEYSGLANIIMTKSGYQPIHNEFFQNDVTAQNLYND